MKVENSGSEVARLRAQIETELEGMRQGLSGIAITAKHSIISNKYNNLGSYQEQLAHEIGEDAANEYLCQSYIRIIG